MAKKQNIPITQNIYPDIELPRWMKSQEKAVILFDDL